MTTYDGDVVLEEKGLFELPIIEGHLGSVKKLDLRQNNLRYLGPPAALKVLAPGLLSLDLYSNHLESLEGIQALTSLAVLNVGMNHLISLRPLSALTKLEVLDAHSNRLEAVDGLQACASLHTANLAGNRLRALPDLTPLTALTDLNLRRNALDALTPVRHEVPHLSDSSESDDEERSWGTEGGADGGRGARSGVLPANLVRLVVAHNRFVTPSALSPLAALTHLTELSAEGAGPWTRSAGPSKYRSAMLALCPPSLLVLDGAELNRVERKVVLAASGHLPTAHLLPPHLSPKAHRAPPTRPLSPSPPPPQTQTQPQAPDSMTQPPAPAHGPRRLLLELQATEAEAGAQKTVVHSQCQPQPEAAEPVRPAFAEVSEAGSALPTDAKPFITSLITGAWAAQPCLGATSSDPMPNMGHKHSSLDAGLISRFDTNKSADSNDTLTRDILCTGSGLSFSGGTAPCNSAGASHRLSTPDLVTLAQEMEADGSAAVTLGCDDWNSQFSRQGFARVAAGVEPAHDQTGAQPPLRRPFTGSAGPPASAAGVGGGVGGGARSVQHPHTDPQSPSLLQLLAELNVLESESCQEPVVQGGGSLDICPLPLERYGSKTLPPHGVPMRTVSTADATGQSSDSDDGLLEELTAQLSAVTAKLASAQLASAQLAQSNARPGPATDTVRAAQGECDWGSTRRSSSVSGAAPTLAPKPTRVTASVQPTLQRLPSTTTTTTATTTTTTVFDISAALATTSQDINSCPRGSSIHHKNHRRSSSLPTGASSTSSSRHGEVLRQGSEVGLTGLRPPPLDPAAFDDMWRDVFQGLLNEGVTRGACTGDGVSASYQQLRSWASGAVTEPGGGGLWREGGGGFGVYGSWGHGSSSWSAWGF